MTQTNGYRGRAVIGLDLDGVVADYEGGFRPYAARHLGVDEATLPEPETYDFPRAGWPLRDHEHFLQVHREAVAEGMLRELPAYPGAVEAIRELSERGAHIRVVTHRLLYGGDHERIVADTAHWLDRVGIPYMSLCFTGLKDSVGAHVYIEDSPNGITAIRDQGIPVIVADQKYNRHLPGPRITDWSRGAELIAEILEAEGQPVAAAR